MDTHAPITHLPDSPTLPLPGVPNWYALRTKSRQEKVVQRQLETDGFEVYLPLQKERRQWSDRRAEVEVPLFPGYAFVKLVEGSPERVRVLRKSGVLGFLGNTQRLSAVRDEEIQNIRLLLASGVPFRPHPYLETGQRVRITAGVLRGLEGTVVRIANDESLVVSIDLIERSLIVRLHGSRASA
jgi:transcription termination/antitermination protein NusG